MNQNVVGKGWFGKPEGFDAHFIEDEDGQGVWVEERAVPKVYNPYSTVGKILNKRDAAGRKASKFVHKRSAPDEPGYVWAMGYNNLVGRATQGKLFPELSGSSLNRKKHGKVIPEQDEDIIKLADTAAVKYAIQGGHPIVEWNGRREYFAVLPEVVRYLLAEGDRESAWRLAMWLSACLGKHTRSISLPFHVLSPRSRGKIKDKATAFYRACPGNRVFATLTFIAPVDDRKGVAILNKFLTQARKKYPHLQYFWVVERQTGERNEARGIHKEATGNVHFHVILNQRLPVGRWNALWTLAQYNAGLIGHTQFGDAISKEEFVAAFQADHKEGYKNKRVQHMLNPFDIKRVKTIGQLSNYLTKYITKQDKEAGYGCAAWHCSRRVSRTFTRQVVKPSAFAYMNSLANCGVDKSTGEVFSFPSAYRTGNGFAVVVYANDKSIPLRYLKRMEKVNKWILEGHEIDRLPMLDDDLFKQRYLCRN